MARGNRGPKAKPARIPLSDLFEAVLTDVIDVGSLSYSEWMARFPSRPFPPPTIKTMDGREYRVTQPGIEAAHQITDRLFEEKPAYIHQVSEGELEKMSFRAIGSALAGAKDFIPEITDEASFDHAAFYAALESKHRSGIDEQVEEAIVDLDRHIPCELFDPDSAVQTFSIGPVTFRPRRDWIRWFVVDDDVRALVEAVQDRAIEAAQLRADAYDESADRTAHMAWRIVDFLRGWGWMATVHVEKHEPIQSHLKGSVLVRLAMDALGCRFLAADAVLFAAAGRQHLYHEQRLASRSDGVLFWGSSSQMAGIGAREGVLQGLIERERSFLDAAGVILTRYQQSRQSGTAPNLVERWANALHWFGEARRQTSDFMAVVNYGVAADILTGAGGLARKIVDFTSIALKQSPQVAVFSTHSIDDVVEQVYVNGRHKFAHGEVGGLFETRTVTRDLGDTLLQTLFDRVTPALAAVITTRPIMLEQTKRRDYAAFTAFLKGWP